MKRTRIPTGVAVMLAAIGVALFPAGAAAQLAIGWYTVDGGGHTFSTGGVLALGGTCGQPDAGALGGGGLDLFGGFWRGGTPVSAVEADEETAQTPAILTMSPARPNPFRDATRFSLELPVAQAVRIEVFDPMGRRVKVLSDAALPAGRHDIVWDGSRANGMRAPCGTYLLRAQIGAETMRRRVVLLR